LLGYRSEKLSDLLQGVGVEEDRTLANPRSDVGRESDSVDTCCSHNDAPIADTSESISTLGGFSTIWPKNHRLVELEG
jgi:hypothetical protein